MHFKAVKTFSVQNRQYLYGREWVDTNVIKVDFRPWYEGFVWPYSPMGYNENIVSISLIWYVKKFLMLYVHKLFLIL